MKHSVVAHAIAVTLAWTGPAVSQGDPGDFPEPAGVRHQRTVTGTAISATSVTTSSGVAAATGDLYLAAVSTRSFEPVVGVTGLGLAWERVADQCSGRGQTGVSLWRAQGTPTGSGPVTATFAAPAGHAVLAVSRYAGVDPELPLGAIVPANTNGPHGACAGGSDGSHWTVPVAVGGGSLVWGAVGHRNRLHTPGAGYEERAQVVVGAGGQAASVSVLDRTVLQPHTVTAQGIFDSDVDWAAIVVEVLPERAVYELDVETIGAGTVVLDPPGPAYRSGTTVELLATPEPGWRFAGWSGALSGSDNPDTLVMSADLSVTATFEEIGDHVLTVGTIGLGNVLVGPPGETYPPGAEVVLIAEPVPGWRFDRWEGDAEGSDNPHNLVMNGDRTVSAVFDELPRHPLDVSVVGAGEVVLSPPGGEYVAGTVVTIDAVPGDGWQFEEWDGAISGSDTPETVVMSGARSVEARFVPSLVGTVVFERVASGGAQFTADVRTDGPLPAGETGLYLTAVTTRPPVPVTGVAGLGLEWELLARQCGGDGTREISVWMAHGTVATASPIAAQLAAEARSAVIGVAHYGGVDAIAPIGAVVAANGHGADGDCAGGGTAPTYAIDLGGTAYQAAAFGAIAHGKETHAPGAGFLERLEAHHGTGAERASVTLTDGDAATAASVVAGAFGEAVAWAGIAVEIRPQLGPGSGYVLETGAQGLGRVETDPPGAYHPPGTVVSVTAVSDGGWAFDGWADGGTANPRTVTMNGDRTVTAVFVELPHAVVQPLALGSGNVVLDPPGGVYVPGTEVLVAAEPLRGWAFDRWEGDLAGSANPVVITGDTDRDVVAVFQYVGPPTPGAWTSVSELADLPTVGPGWNEMLFAANESFRPPLIQQDSDDNVRCLAAAIVHARTGEPAYRQEVAGACDDLVAAGLPPDDTLTWAREIGAYAMAADLVDHRSPALAAWFRNVAEVWEATDERTLRTMFHERPNNWGTMAFATLCAVYSYLDDYEALADLRAWWIQGVRGPDPGWSWGGLSWHADPADPRQINPPGATRNGVVIDGVMPDDQRRGGDFSDPPGRTGYPWGALQGLVAAARVLERHDPWLGIWHVEDRAIHRAARLLQVTWEGEYGGWAASGDDEWLLRFLDEAYGTSWATDEQDGWGAGKNAGWAWVLAPVPLPTGGPLGAAAAPFRIEQNFPNPFGPGTRIRYHLPRSERVRLTIYDVMGRAVVTLTDGVRPAGAHTLRWDGVDSGGGAVASGVYWCRIETGSRSDVIKLTRIR